MKKLLFLISLVVGLGLLASAVYAQGKAAYVDSEIILRDLPEAQKASKELEVMVKAWQDSLEKMTADLQKQVEEYQKQQSVMPAAKKDAEEKRLGELDQKRREYAAAKLDARQGEAAVTREKKLAPIREKILKTIEGVAKEEGYTFVFDRANVLYADAKVDLTYKVLDRLKRGTSGRGK
ncbi:MAG: OmpH family outer membrane protein [Ignavibacteriales bacterium]|nr:OmpH family outer membrane protein [Ignavibacteriales bacterium]